MRSRRRSRPHCARCGGPKRHPSEASITCRSCGDLVCIKHSVEAPEYGGWICTRCNRDTTREPGG